MAYRIFALVVIATSLVAIGYVLAIDEAPQAIAASDSTIKPTIVDLTGSIHPVGKPLSHPFTFHNTQGRPITITKLKPCCIGTEVDCDKTFPMELGDKDQIAFTVSITPGPNDFGSATAAYVYWKTPESEEEHMEIFRINFHCTFEWVLSQNRVDLGKLAIGKEIPPVVVALKRLKDSSFLIKQLQIDSNEAIKVEVTDLSNPKDISPQTPIERQHSADIKIHLPAPTHAGGYAQSITIKDSSSDHIEVIELTGVVTD